MTHVAAHIGLQASFQLMISCIAHASVLQQGCCELLHAVHPDVAVTCHCDACRPASDPQLMSYRIFLDSFLLPFKVGEGPAIEAMNTAIKSDRQKLKRIFTEAGQPGDMFRSLFAFESIMVVIFIVMVVWHFHQKLCCRCQCCDHLPQSVTLDVSKCAPVHCCSLLGSVNLRVDAV